jgi:hypothetical protein
MGAIAYNPLWYKIRSMIQIEFKNIYVCIYLEILTITIFQLHYPLEYLLN